VTDEMPLMLLIKQEGMMSQDTDTREHGTPSSYRSGDSPMSEAEIDINIMGSFPASDPPSWTLGVERRKHAPPEYMGARPSTEAPSHHNERTPSA
jgi:hypothetical protein